MRAVEVVFAVAWAAFWLYWLVAAFSMKKGHVPWSRELRIRAVIVVALILLVRSGAFRGHGLNTDPWRAGLGFVLLALGLGLAIWARVHIGRNWGTPMTQKDEPELVTSGPYHLVRHPIYSGILVAGVGTAVALSWLWLIAVVFGRGLLRLQRDRRGALHDRAVPRCLPGVQALDQDARAVPLLSGRAGVVPARTASGAMFWQIGSAPGLNSASPTEQGSLRTRASRRGWVALESQY
jgi:protein-S-isoprenylcysteine O-methyltransferase Ste14